MLLYKGWLETRFRLIVSLILGLFYCWIIAVGPAPATGQVAGAAAIIAISATLMTVMLAGAGIVTESAMLANKGLHGSTLYTLSLPVSRMRIISVRAGLGWVEMAAGVALMSGVMWFIDPPVRSAVTPAEMAAYALTLITCISGLYAITVFLSTFLDDVWRIFGSFIFPGSFVARCERNPHPKLPERFQSRNNGIVPCRSCHALAGNGDFAYLHRIFNAGGGEDRANPRILSVRTTEMLFYKGWLETRFRMLFAIGLGLLLCSMFGSSGAPAGTEIAGAGAIMTMAAAFTSTILAGAGIFTQSALLSSRGLHGSALYTLSLPVSRARVVGIRAGVGWIEMAAGMAVISVAMWFGYTPLNEAVGPLELAEFLLTLLACVSCFYSITVLLATFLDDIWRVFGSFISIAVLWFTAARTHLPDSINIFRAMTAGSPLVTHAIPWGAIAVSLAFSAALILAAVKIAQIREY